MPSLHRYYVGFSLTGRGEKRHALGKEEPHALRCTGQPGRLLLSTSDKPVELAEHWVSETYLFCENCKQHL